MKPAKLFFLVTFLLSTRSFASIDSMLMVDLGFGLPQLPSVEVAYRALKSWQVGITYGIIPGAGAGGSISPSYKFPSQNETLKSGTHLTFNEPEVTSTLNSLCPFVRFFPNETNFYVQLTMGVLRVHNSFTSDVSDVTGTKIPGATYSGNIDVLQLLPTISIGHVFSSKVYFFNVNMGATIVATATTSSNFTGNLPAALGGNSANQDVLDKVNAQAQDAVQSANQKFRDEVLFLPSIQMTFGFMF